MGDSDDEESEDERGVLTGRQRDRKRKNKENKSKKGGFEDEGADDLWDGFALNEVDDSDSDDSAIESDEMEDEARAEKTEEGAINTIERLFTSFYTHCF